MIHQVGIVNYDDRVLPMYEGEQILFYLIIEIIGLKLLTL